VSRRWTPTLATTTALVVLTATGGMVPSAAVFGGPPERATTYLTPPLTPSSQQPAEDARAGVVSARDAVAVAGSREGRGEGTAEQSGVHLVQSSSPQDVLERYAGEVPSYVDADPVTVVGLGFDHPVAGPFTLSSAFGWRMNPTDVGPAVQFHIGLDYAVACGTPVRAAADGAVVSAGERGTGGLRIDIDHGDGLGTSYRHNSVLLVSAGDRVSRGDVIGMSGTTGNSTGCHLHFDATLDGQYIDPAQLLPSVPGQPRPMDAEDLKRIRAAAEQAASAVRQERTDAAAPRTPAAAAAGEDHATEAPASGNREPRPQPPARTEKPASPGSSSDHPAPKPSGTAKPDKTASPGSSSDHPAPKPSGTAKPDKPEPSGTGPTEPGAAQPKPTDPGSPAVTEPTEPATPEPTQPSKPEPTQPTQPTKPTKPEPTVPEPTEPATPEPTKPSKPEPTVPEPTVPEPTKPTKPEPPSPAEPLTPPAPQALTPGEAAQWCLPLEDEAEKAPDFSALFTGDFADLVGLVAALDEEGLPESVTEETLIEVSPSALWLESLPACSDAEFLEAALAARSAG
jgi:murein DD-endopeptidase MepM/ murein hydrolase activator NlpD